MPRVVYIEGGVEEVNAHIRSHLGAYDPLLRPKLISVQFSRLGAYVVWSE